MSEPHSGTPWYQQAGVLLGLAAIILAGFALASHRDETRRAQREEFRKLITQLQEATSAVPTAGDRGSAARPWISFDAIRRLEPELGSDVSVVDYLVLANFAFAHSDLQLGEEYVKKAQRTLEQGKNLTTKSLAQMAIGHIHFRHLPKTSLEDARKFFEQARTTAKNVDERQRGFVLAGLEREWALDELSAGNAAEGEEHGKQAKEILDSMSLPEKYLSDWQADFDSAAIQAKVRGGLL